MIENMKESFLSFLFSGKFMHIIQNQNVNHLIKMEKIVPVIVSGCFRKLCLKFICIYIQHHLVGHVLFHFNTDCLRQMGFAQSRISVKHQRVESRSARIVRHGKAGTSSKAVAVSFNKIFKSIIGFQLRINLQLLNAGYNKGISDRPFFIRQQGNVKRFILNFCGTAGWIFNSQRVTVAFRDT